MPEIYPHNPDGPQPGDLFVERNEDDNRLRVSRVVHVGNGEQVITSINGIKCEIRVSPGGVLAANEYDGPLRPELPRQR